MTTIIYDHKALQVAVDSRCTSGSIIINDRAKKWREINGSYYFFAGPVSDIEQFIKLDGIRGKPDHANEVICVKITDHVAYLCGIDADDGWWQEEFEFSDGAGSGRFFALSALDFGKTAKQAVEYAATRDVYTGGQVEVFDILKMTFISQPKNNGVMK